jgi:hypothetical protein
VETPLQPYFRKRFLLSKPEKHFYNILREVVGNYTVLAKVRLADLVEANERHPEWQANFIASEPKTTLIAARRTAIYCCS